MSDLRETIEQEAQRVVEKRQRWETFVRSLDAAERARIPVVVNYMTGLPGVDPAAEAACRAVVEHELEALEADLEVADDADALVLVTEWQQYRSLNWEAIGARMRSRIILDGRLALDRNALLQLGFKYLAIGL